MPPPSQRSESEIRVKKLGVVGCGFFAQNHLHAWADLKPRGVEITAVCDVDSGKAEAERFRGPHWYSDAETIFGERGLGLVDIVTQVDAHQTLVDLAIRHKVRGSRISA
jgi:predicted dehydrogenase